MKKSPFFLVALFIILANCGRKAPPLPPIIKIPKTVTNLKAKQVGNNIFLFWKNPTSYTDGSPLTGIKEIQIFIYEKERSYRYFKFNKKEFLKKAKIIEIEEAENYIYSLKKKDIGKKEMIFAVIVKDLKNKTSNLSEPVSIKPGIPPPPPKNISFSIYEDKILLKWEKPKGSPLILEGFKIYRWTEGNTSPIALNSTPVKTTIFEDRNFIFNKKYFYTVRSVIHSSLKYIPLPYPFLFFSIRKGKLQGSEIESENSPILQIIPKDTFPPKPPQGLVAIAEEEAITLIWDPNNEKDLKGYKIWRKAENEERFFLLTPKPILNNSYRDEKIEKNMIYYYFVTAVDKRNNESEKSQIIKIKI